MELYRGQPYWPTTWQGRSYPRLQGERSCDAAIIGGGVSGLLCAYVLSRAGHRVILLEKGRIGRGSTSLNTGLIEVTSDHLLTELEVRFGRNIAAHFYQASAGGLDLLREIARELSGDAQVRCKDSLYLAARLTDRRKLEQEAVRQQAIGLPSRFLSSKDLHRDYGISAHGAILTHNDAQLNPYRFTHLMAQTACERYGLVIQEQTPIRETDMDFAGHMIRAGDLTVRYRRLIIATGYDVFAFEKEHLPQMDLVSTFAAVTEAGGPQAPFVELPLIWESARPYLYWRSTADGRLIVGGKDEPDTRLSQDKSRRFAETLIAEAADRMGGLSVPPPAFWYEAVFGESRDGLPYAGPHPVLPDVFLMRGIGGNGTLYAAISAKIAQADLEERLDDSFTYLYPGAQRRLSKK